MELRKGMYIRTKLNDFCNMVAIRKIEKIDLLAKLEAEDMLEFYKLGE